MRLDARAAPIERGSRFVQLVLCCPTGSGHAVRAASTAWETNPSHSSSVSVVPSRSTWLRSSASTILRSRLSASSTRNSYPSGNAPARRHRHTGLLGELHLHGIVGRDAALWTLEFAVLVWKSPLLTLVLATTSVTATANAQFLLPAAVEAGPAVAADPPPVGLVPIDDGRGANVCLGVERERLDTPTPAAGDVDRRPRLLTIRGISLGHSSQYCRGRRLAAIAPCFCSSTAATLSMPSRQESLLLHSRGWRDPVGSVRCL